MSGHTIATSPHGSRFWLQREQMKAKDAAYHCPTCCLKHELEADAMRCMLSHFKPRVRERYLCGICPDGMEGDAHFMQPVYHESNCGFTNGTQNYAQHLYRCTICHEYWTLKVEGSACTDPVISWRSWGKDTLKVVRT